MKTRAMKRQEEAAPPLQQRRLSSGRMKRSGLGMALLEAKRARVSPGSISRKRLAEPSQAMPPMKRAKTKPTSDITGKKRKAIGESSTSNKRSKGKPKSKCYNESKTVRKCEFRK